MSWGKYGPVGHWLLRLPLPTINKKIHITSTYQSTATAKNNHNSVFAPKTNRLDWTLSALLKANDFRSLEKKTEDITNSNTAIISLNIIYPPWRGCWGELYTGVGSLSEQKYTFRHAQSKGWGHFHVNGQLEPAGWKADSVPITNRKKTIPLIGMLSTRKSIQNQLRYL